MKLIAQRNIYRRSRQILAICATVSMVLVLPSAGQAQRHDFDDHFEEEFEGDLEEQFEEDIEEGFEEDIEEGFEEDIEEQFEEDIEEGFEENIEERFEEEVEGRFEEDIEERFEEDIEEGFEDDIEERFEEDIEEGFEEDIEGRFERDAEGRFEEDIEGRFEEEVETRFEEELDDDLEDHLEHKVEKDFDEDIERDAEENLEERLNEDLEEDFDRDFDEDADREFDQNAETEFEERLERELESEIEADFQGDVEERLEDRVGDGIDEALIEDIAEDISESFETELEVSESRIHTDEWLIMAEPEAIAALGAEGYVFESLTQLSSLGLQLAAAKAPASFSLSDTRTAVLEVVGESGAEVDLNHLYAAGEPGSASTTGFSPAEMEKAAMRQPTALRIGMVDSQVDLGHTSLAEANIQSRHFAANRSAPADHGTAIASILVGDSEDFSGIAPGSELFAASVFEVSQNRQAVATTVALIRAVDWLVSENVDVINFSLAGPPNQLLAAALERVSSQGIVLAAAAGNGGPAAAPGYPAAHPDVVAVTAVDINKRVYRLANSGSYIDLAAPGVDLRHARPGGGYVASSGTSFAVPFVAVGAARALKTNSPAAAKDQLFSRAEDLGAPGKDPVYGYGLIRYGR